MCEVLTERIVEGLWWMAVAGRPAICRVDARQMLFGFLPFLPLTLMSRGSASSPRTLLRGVRLMSLGLEFCRVNLTGRSWQVCNHSATGSSFL